MTPRLDKRTYARELRAAWSDSYTYDPAVYTQQRYVAARVAQVLESLTKLEVWCLRRRYWYAETLEEIANQRGVTSTRIQQIEAKALRKLRHPVRRSMLMHLIGIDKKPCVRCLRCDWVTHFPKDGLCTQCYPKFRQETIERERSEAKEYWRKYYGAGLTADAATDLAQFRAAIKILDTTEYTDEAGQRIRVEITSGGTRYTLLEETPFGWAPRARPR